MSGSMVSSFPLPRCVDSVGCGSGRDEEPSGEKAVLRQIQIRLARLSLQKSTPRCQEKNAAMRISNLDRVQDIEKYDRP